MGLEIATRGLRHWALAAAMALGIPSSAGADLVRSSIQPFSKVSFSKVTPPPCGAFSEAYPDFALSMIANASDNGADNAIVSPSGLEATLAMMYQGATAPFRQVIEKIFSPGMTGEPWLPDCRLDELRTRKMASRVALVIGNADYGNLLKMANPVNDATAIGAALHRLGFDVTTLENTTRHALDMALLDFREAALGATMAVVFYAGHGFQMEGQDYLLTIEAPYPDLDPDRGTVPLDRVRHAVEGASDLGLVILDSSRPRIRPDHPAPDRTGDTRGIDFRAPGTKHILVAYAAAGEDGVALDGTGQNSPYTEALLAHLEEPGLELGLMFRKVSAAVKTATDNSQRPYTHGTLPPERIYLAAQSRGTSLSRANAVFADHALDIYPAFQSVVTERLGARVAQFDFAAPDTVARINAWVAQATNRTVPELLDHLDPDERLVMASALYFRGDWHQAFDSDDTVQAPFYPETGEAVNVAFLHSGNYPALFYEDGDFSAIELGYGPGTLDEAYALRFILPRDGLTARDALTRLSKSPAWTGTGFERISRSGHGIIRLPRMTLDGRTDLLPLLQEYGFADALAPDAAFAGIASPAPRLGRILQAAQLTVDESGSEASAATAAVFSTRSGIDIDPPFEITLDRPFALALRKIVSGELLFVGWVANPGVR